MALDIPVINSRNIELAMQNVLGKEQKCYVARLPLDARKIISDIEKAPTAIKDEIETAYKTLRKKKDSETYGGDSI